MRAARVHRDDHAIGMRSTDVREERGIERGAGADDGPLRARLEHGVDRGEITQASARFDRHRCHRGDDLGDERGLPGRPRERTVEVDDVQTFGAERSPLHRHRHRVLREHGLGVGTAFAQTHAPPIAQVDGGDDDHPPPFTSAAKFSRRRWPHRWLFSG